MSERDRDLLALGFVWRDRDLLAPSESASRMTYGPLTIIDVEPMQHHVPTKCATP